MKIMDKKVMHKRFGMGSVIGLKDNKIYEDLQEELMEDIGRRI